MSLMAGAAIGAATGLLQQGVGAIFANGAMNRQVAAQKELTDYNTEKSKQAQLEMWQKTNYPAQIQMMKKAGVNPALMMSKGGAQGQTGQGAVTQSVQAPTPSQNNIGMMAMQGAMMQAQLENIKADTTKKIAEASNADRNAGVQGAQQSYLTTSAQLNEANKALTDTDNKIQELNLNYKQQTFDTSIQQFKDIAAQTATRLGILKNEGKISDATLQIKIDQEATRLAEMFINIKAKEAGITLTEKQTWAVGQKVAQDWQANAIAQQNANTGTRNAQTNATNVFNNNSLGWENLYITGQKMNIDKENLRRLWDAQTSEKFKNYMSGIGGLIGGAVKVLK